MRTPALLAIALLFMVSPRLHASSLQASADEEALVALENAWDQALYSRDVAFVDQVLAEEFVAIYPDGTRGDRAGELALVAAFNQQVDSSTHDDMTVRVYGDTAVVWFTLRLTGPKDGRPTVLLLRYVDVFVRRAGRWQCVSSQSTRATP